MLWLEHAGDTTLAIVVAMLLVEGLVIIVWQGITRRKFGQSTPRIMSERHAADELGPSASPGRTGS